MARNQAPNLIAGGDVAVSTFVKVSTVHDNTALQAGANEAVIGISQVGPRDAPGLSGSSALAAKATENLEIFGLGDICLLKAGTGGFTRGDYLESDASGFGVSSGTGSTRNIGAIALESTAQGEYGLVQVLIFHKGSDTDTTQSSLTLTTTLTFDLSGGSSGDGKIALTDNLADALSVKESTNSYMTFTTTDGSEAIKFHKTVTFDGTTGANLIKMPDNLADALSIAEGSTEYLTFVTTDSGELISLKKATTITSTGANALAVGPNGTTNPTLKVVGSVSSEAGGLSITGGADAVGVALAAIGSNTNEPLTFDGKGSGLISIGTVSTGGAIVRTKVATVVVGGTAIGNANAVTEGYTRVTSSDDTAAVILPASVAGKVCTVKNTVANKILIVFPPVSSQINAKGVNNAYNMAAGTLRTFRCFNSVLWESDLETIG